MYMYIVRAMLSHMLYFMYSKHMCCSMRTCGKLYISLGDSLLGVLLIDWVWLGGGGGGHVS